jgi:TM2 domain-containing membrane protein YozV
MKDKTTAILLSIFLGGIGAHHFYLGDSKKGILYLVFCWTMVPGILAIVDLVKFIKMSDEEFNLQYNSGVNPGLTGQPMPGFPGQPMAPAGQPVLAAPAQVAPSVQVQNAPAMMPVSIEAAQDEFIGYLKSNAQFLQEIIEQHKQKQNTISQAAASSFDQPQPVIQPADSAPQEVDKIDVSCAHCGHAYTGISIKHKGRTVSCKKCQQSVTI